jgi:ABC-2 type transport system ATP-binding protein
MAMLDLINITKKYNKSSKPALDNLNISMKEGEILGFAGLNGAGKSTAMRISAGVTIPTSGTVLIKNINLASKRNEAIQNIGFVPDSDNIDLHYKAIDLMRYYCGLYGMNGIEATQRSEELLDLVGLEKKKRVNLKKYSYGMRKRFLVASSLIANPDILLFDEPFNGLDPNGFRFLENILLKSKSEGKSVFISTHVLSELSNLADRVAIINAGKILKILNKNDITSSRSRIIKVKLNRTSESALKALKKFGEVESTENTITILEPNIEDTEIQKVSEILGKEGLVVYECYSSKEELEDLFFKIIKEQDQSI